MEFTTVTSAVTAASGVIFDQVGTVIDTIMAHPLLLLPIGVTFVGLALGYAKSLIRV